MPPLDEIHRVLVLGAGLAGLAAGRALTQLGYEVTILEARNRIGGRCWTRAGVDLGAHWIHSTEGNPITSLARELGLPTLFVGGDSTYTGGWEALQLLSEGGGELSVEHKQRSILVADAVRDGLDALRLDATNRGSADISMGDAIDQVLSGMALTESEQAAVAWHLHALIRDDCAADAGDLSFQFWDDGYEVYGYGDSILPMGFGSLAESLATRQDIRLGHVVTSIAHGRDVRVTTHHGQEFSADAAIVTLPLGVLKSGTVHFDPPLPERKRAAIERLGVALLDKIVLTYDEPFWPTAQYVFACPPARVQDGPTCVINLWKTHRVPKLVLLAGGPLALRIEESSDAEVWDWSTSVLAACFGGTTPSPRQVERTGWGADPFARGSYSYIAVGSTPEDLEILGEPVGERLFFAGEATVRQHWATTHSAYVSGLREAARISGHAEILPPRHFTENRHWRDMTQRANRFFNMRGRGLSQADLRERVAVLRENPVFGSVPASELDVLATMFDVRSYAAGDAICTFGEAAREIYVVVDGAATLEVQGSPVLSSLGRGDVFGEYGLFGAGTRSATIRAHGPVVALVLDYERFQRYLLAFPQSMATLLKVTVQRLLEREAQPSSNADVGPRSA